MSGPEIRILQQLEGAGQAEGLAVIIDVFRAFTVEPWIIFRGAGELYCTADEQTARRQRDIRGDTVLVGERRGVMLPGFDFGNSPSQICRADLSGRTVVHTTSAGTQGINAASGADEILTGSFVNAQAVAEYIRRSGCPLVSLVCMGLGGKEPTDEDTLCAEYIRSLLTGTSFSLKEQMEKLRQTSGAKFFDPAQQSVFPEMDFWMSLETDRFPFVLRAEKQQNGLFRMLKTDVP